MMISNIITLDRIKICDDIKNKEVLIKELLDLADLSGKISDFELVTKDVITRESIMSTGVGKSIALPHAKTDHINENIGSMIISKNDIDYDSLDNKPVKIAFLLLSRSNDVGWHLKMLSRISRFLNNDSYREKLLNADKTSDVMDSIKVFDKAL